MDITGEYERQQFSSTSNGVGVSITLPQFAAAAAVLNTALNTVVKWLQNNPEATPQMFEDYLHNLHQQPWLKERIPNVNLK